MEKFGANDAGRAHDGDRTFVADLVEQAERVLSRMWELLGDGSVLKATCAALIKVLPPDELRDYFDQWHVEKNTRSAIIGSGGGEGGGPMSIPANQASSVNTDMLVAAGLLPMALKNDSYRAMSDGLVWIVVGHPMLRAAFDKKDWKLVLWLLIPYLSHTVNFHERGLRLSRDDRVDRLTLVLHLAVHFIAVWDPSRGTRKTYSGAAFSRDLLLKYVLNAMYQLSQLVQNEPLWMGALGSHLVEHYFAELRRLMGG
jgi:hypothetical protein